MNKIKSGMQIFEKGQKIHITEWDVLEEVIEVGTKYKQAIYKTNNIVIGDVKNSDIDFEKTLKAMGAIGIAKSNGVILIIEKINSRGTVQYKENKDGHLGGGKNTYELLYLVDNGEEKESPRYLVEEEFKNKEVLKEDIMKEFGVPKHILEGHREFKAISTKEDENGLVVEFEEDFEKENIMTKKDVRDFSNFILNSKHEQGLQLAFDINLEMARKLDSQEEVSGYFVNGPTIRTALKLGLEKYVGGLELACELHMETIIRRKKIEKLSEKANEELRAENCKFYDMLVEDKTELEKCIDKIKTLKRENELQSRNIDLRDKEIEELKKTIGDNKVITGVHQTILELEKEEKINKVTCEQLAKELEEKNETIRRLEEYRESNFEKFVKRKEENELLRRLLKVVL